VFSTIVWLFSCNESEDKKTAYFEFSAPNIMLAYNSVECVTSALAV
jgi:hypothetical protein